MRKIALVPAYEPETLMLDLLDELKRENFTTVVVDDGSGENYRDIFTLAGETAAVLRHETNRGKGASLKTGLRYIRDTYPEGCVVVTLDADGQHRVSDAVQVCVDAVCHPGSLVLGSRAFTGRVPLRSRFGNTVTRGVFRLTTGKKVGDTQTGLRSFTSELIPFLLGVEGERYEYEMNVLLDCARRDIPIREVGIETVYLGDNASSHFDTVRDSVRIYREILKFAASSLTGFAVDYGLYSLLVTVTAGLGAASAPLSNVAARVVSASVNFTINKKLVFKSDESTLRTGAQYFTLAACILAGNTVLLSWLVNGLGVNKFAAKIVTEITFFTISWCAQKFFIFKKRPVRKTPRKEISL